MPRVAHTEAERRLRATRAAAWTAGAVFIVALLALAWGFRAMDYEFSSDPGVVAVTHVASAQPAPAPSVTVVETTVAGSTSTVRTEVTGVPGQTTETTTTETTAGTDTSVLGRIFENPAVAALLQVLIAGVIAFLAGAAVQRVLLGAYEFTVGKVALPALPPVTEKDVNSVDSKALAIAGKDVPRTIPLVEWETFSEVEPIVADVRVRIIGKRAALEVILRVGGARIGLSTDAALDSILLNLSSLEAGDRHGDLALPKPRATALEKLLVLGDRLSQGAAIDATTARRLDTLFDQALTRVRPLVTPRVG